MKTLLKVLGIAVVGVVAVAVFFWVLGWVIGLLKLALVVAIFAAIGYGVIRLLAAGESRAPALPSPSEAKTEESRTLSADEKKAMSDADALKAFEDARKKHGGNGS